MWLCTLLVLVVALGFASSVQAVDDYMEAEELSAGLAPDAGVEAYRFAAQQGDVLAQLNLGAMFYYGLGTPKNYSKALFWYRKAAQQGEALAQFKLGVMLEEGLGVTRNLAEAAQWLRQVAVRNLPMDTSATDIVGWSRLKLGLMYKEGRGVAKDPAQSSQWFRLAAERGYVVAQYQLGQMALQSGDPVEAWKWFKKAAAQGHGEAATSLAALEKQLSPAQMAKATSEMAQPPVPVAVPVVSDNQPATHVALPRTEATERSPVPAPADPIQEKAAPQSGQLIFPLTVAVDPPDAKVQILNITPPYYPGMALEPGRYHVKVVQEGFEAQKRWVTLGHAPLQVPVKLERLAKTPPSPPDAVQKPSKAKPPVEAAKPPVEAAKPPVEAAKPPVEAAKPPVEVVKAPVEAAKPPVEVAKPPVEAVKPVPEKPSMTSILQVKPEPADAKVRILNIREAYHPRMELKAGRYLVEVSRSGYKTASRWMQLPGGGEFEIIAPLEPE